MARSGKTLRILHGFSLLVLFATGLTLVYQSSLWFTQQQGTWLAPTALGIVGGSCLCLSLFGQKHKTEGVVAATIVSAFWTVAAAVAFAKNGSNVEAWTLLVASIAQLASCIIGAAVTRGSRAGDGDEFLDSSAIGNVNGNVTRNYGALSSFIDPLSSAAGTTTTTTRPGPSGSQISQASASPTTSPQLLGRTPSPFDRHTSPHRLAPASLASLSAAATPRETPEDIKQSYKALWEKYDLDT